MQKKLLFKKPKPQHIPFVLLAVLLVALSVGFVLALFASDVYSATGNIYVSPGSTAKSGSDLTTTIRITPGTKIDTVTASVRYSANELTYVKADYGNSPFATQIPAVVKDGTVTVQAAKLGGATVDVDALIAVLHFTALKDSPTIPKLIYANAAYAGVATNPTIDGKTVDESANPLAVANTAVSTGGQATSNGTSRGILKPIATLLQKVGVSSQVAKRAAPWLAGILLTILIAGLLLIGFYFWKKYGKRRTIRPAREQEQTL